MASVEARTETGRKLRRPDYHENFYDNFEPKLFVKGYSEMSPFPKTLSVQNGDVTDGVSFGLPPFSECGPFPTPGRKEPHSQFSSYLYELCLAESYGLSSHVVTGRKSAAC